MNHSDIYTKFVIEYDKANITSSYPQLTKVEIATILDKAYLAIIAQKLTRNNPRKQGFESDIKAIEDLAPLIKTSKIKLKISSPEIGSLNQLVFDIPDDYDYYIQSRLQYNGKQRRVSLISHEAAQMFRVTDDNLPWMKNPVAFIEGDNKPYEIINATDNVYPTYEHTEEQVTPEPDQEEHNVTPTPIPQEDPSQPEEPTPGTEEQPSHTADITYVDMGTSVKWASRTLHDDYQWASLIPGYNWDNTNPINNDQKNIKNLNDTQYDTAKYKLGDNWRMPTASELQQLYDVCKGNITHNEDKTLTMTSNKTGNSIVLDLRGFINDAGYKQSDTLSYIWSQDGDGYGEATYAQISTRDIVIKDKLNQRVAMQILGVYTDSQSVGTPEEEQQPYFGKSLNAIDMGTSVKWADRNLLAISPDSNGGYFQYGSLESKQNFTKDDYTAIDKDISGTENDTATKLCGSGWRTPTAEEFEELVNNCIITVGDDYEHFVLKSNTTGNTLKFYTTGIKIGDKIDFDDNACLWTGSYDSYYGHQGEHTAMKIEFAHGTGGNVITNILYDYQYKGMQIRPVKV